MAFNPPSSSLGQLQGVPFSSAIDAAPDLKQIYDDFDKTPDGKNDPNKCKALLKFPNGTIFWSSKMAIDADGPAAGPDRRSGTQLDPGSGQDDTTFHYPGTNKGLASEVVPFIVLPGGSFGSKTGLAIGDMAIVIFGDKIAAAICGDLGPTKKIGEGSIRIHEHVHPPAPDPCIRNDQGFCRRIHNVSIDEDVLFFAFPGSSIVSGLTQETIETKVKEKAFALYNKLRGV
jgi:glycosyl hydrolase group 75 (putative chitosanase)